MFGRSASFLAATLKSGRPASATVRGTSMWPTLSPGDRVQIDPIPPRWVPTPGDVVAVAGPTGIVVHRVIASSRGSVVTWGDNASMADVPTEISNVVGRVDPAAGQREWFRWAR